MLTEILQASLTSAKYQQSIETDVLHHLALLKFITIELGNQFSTILVECKDWIRGRGSLFEHSEQAHVMRSKIAEIQTDRKNVIRQVGETLCRIWREVEEGSHLQIAPRALRRRFSRNLRAPAESVPLRRSRQRRPSVPRALRPARQLHE